MSVATPPREQFLHQVGVPNKVHPMLGWSISTSGDLVLPDINDQFCTIPIPSEDGARATHTNSIRADFQLINQEWIVQSHPPNDITDSQPQPYRFKTPGEKFEDLSHTSTSINALAIDHWIAAISDGGDPQYTPPVAIVLGPLINSPPLRNNIGHKLGDLGIDFYVLAQPLGKLWTSHHIYPLITPLFNNTQKLTADKLVCQWDDDWSSIYQFDHGLKACRSIATADTHDNPQDPDLLSHLLWTPSSGPNNTLPQVDKADGIPLIKLCTGALSGAWTLSKHLLLPPGGNLPIGFGMAVNDLFSRETFILQLATEHGQSLASHVDSWMQAP